MKRAKSLGRMGADVAFVAAEVAAFSVFLNTKILTASNLNETIISYIQYRLSNYSPGVQRTVQSAMTDLMMSHLNGGMFNKAICLE